MLALISASADKRPCTELGAMTTIAQKGDNPVEYISWDRQRG